MSLFSVIILRARRVIVYRFDFVILLRVFNWVSAVVSTAEKSGYLSCLNREFRWILSLNFGALKAVFGLEICVCIDWFRSGCPRWLLVCCGCSEYDIIPAVVKEKRRCNNIDCAREGAWYKCLNLAMWIMMSSQVTDGNILKLSYLRNKNENQKSENIPRCGIACWSTPSTLFLS